MFFKLPAWVNRKEEQKRLKADLVRKKLSTYGFLQVPESEKVNYVMQHFNSVARHYDIMNTILSLGIHYLWKRMAVGLIGLRPGGCVLDVCGGTGDLAILAGRKIGKSGQIILYDINREMILAGKNKPTNRGIRNRITHVQGDIEALSFPDDRFDAAMVGFGIRNVTHMETGFKEIYRVLKPGGTFMCLEFSQPVWPMFRFLYDIYSFYIMPWLGERIAGSRKAYLHLPETIRLFPLPDDLSEIIEQIGFVNVRYRRLTNGIAVVHIAVKPESAADAGLPGKCRCQTGCTAG
ncbi:MAG: bifunctional demethylmenaquinone methyltransferase/2-methoxy-6-polyprenyl-1,4-benzoquinol methylase UbiE [Desulfatirhabdiaceae bacterium]